MVKRWERTARVLTRISLTTPSRSFGPRPKSTGIDQDFESILLAWPNCWHWGKNACRKRELPSQCRQRTPILTGAGFMDRIGGSGGCGCASKRFLRARTVDRSCCRTVRTSGAAAASPSRRILNPLPHLTGPHRVVDAQQPERHRDRSPNALRLGAVEVPAARVALR